MLVELEIRDFALIEHVKVHWTSGLNVLTGETGAGKSIIIDALNAVLGGKVGPTFIRTGAERAVVEATFTQTTEISGWLKLQQLQSDDFAQLSIYREISRSGSRARINGTPVNLSILQDLRQKLVTIHAQHEGRTLLSTQAQLDMLDGLGDRSHAQLREKLSTLYARGKDLREQLEEIQLSDQERLRTLDFARFQLAELEEAAISAADEDEAVEAQCRVLANVAQLDNCTLVAGEALSGSDCPGATSAADLLSQALLKVEAASAMDARLSALAESLRETLTTIAESARELRRYKESLDTDPETLAALEARLTILTSIKRKYGPTLAQAMARRDELAGDIDRLENTRQCRDRIEKELSLIDQELEELAAELSGRRRSLAGGFASAIEHELSHLSMERCRFQVGFQAAELSATGADRVEFVISPNPGQPLLPLAKIASGGELSRVMLAIKSIVAEADRVPTVIFDEIDTGLSGRALKSMRAKLSQLARSHQILSITHQPLIASVATSHLEVIKQQSDSYTQVSVQALDDEARVRSLAAMASGQSEEGDSLRFARSLLEQGTSLRGT